MCDRPHSNVTIKGNNNNNKMFNFPFSKIKDNGNNFNKIKNKTSSLGSNINHSKLSSDMHSKL